MLDTNICIYTIKHQPPYVRVRQWEIVDNSLVRLPACVWSFCLRRFH